MSDKSLIGSKWEDEEKALKSVMAGASKVSLLEVWWSCLQFVQAGSIALYLGDDEFVSRQDGGAYCEDRSMAWSLVWDPSVVTTLVEKDVSRWLGVNGREEVTSAALSGQQASIVTRLASNLWGAGVSS